MEKNKSFNWLFIGAGRIANKVAKEIHKEHNIYAVFSRTKNKVKKFAKRYNSKTYFNLDEALKDSNIDAVYIATPHSSHYKLMKKVIENKIPVLCEKAFTLNYNQAKEIFYLAEKNNTYVVEAMWTMFNPLVEEVFNLIEKKELGEIQHFRASMCYSAELSMAPKRVREKSQGGGAILDTLVYPLSFATKLLGFPRSMKTEIKVDEKNNLDQTVITKLRYLGNKTALLESSISKFTKCKGLILTTKGSIYFPFCFYKPNKVIIKIDNKKEILKTKRGYIYQFNKVRDDILNKEKISQNVPKKLTLDVLKITDTIRKNSNIYYEDDLERI